jgi:hypothetical protein
MVLLAQIADMSHLELAWIAPRDRLEVEEKFVHVAGNIAY